MKSSTTFDVLRATNRLVCSFVINSRNYKETLWPLRTSVITNWPLIFYKIFFQIHKRGIYLYVQVKSKDNVRPNRSVDRFRYASRDRATTKRLPRLVVPSRSWKPFSSKIEGDSLSWNRRPQPYRKTGVSSGEREFTRPRASWSSESVNRCF